jgi:4a-hydroxytetrahydrobiopterin dehydratase
MNELARSDLANQDCVPCKGGVPPMSALEIQETLRQVPEWKAVDNHHLTRTFTFRDFKQALDFVNRAGAIAEQQGHHPDIFLAWGKAEITLWTHKVNGLTHSDFVMAAKIDQILAGAG